MSREQAICWSIIITCSGLALTRLNGQSWTESIIMAIVGNVVVFVFYVAHRLGTDDDLLTDVRRRHGVIHANAQLPDTKEVVAEMLSETGYYDPQRREQPSEYSVNTDSVD